MSIAIPQVGQVDSWLSRYEKKWATLSNKKVEHGLLKYAGEAIRQSPIIAIRNRVDRIIKLLKVQEKWETEVRQQIASVNESLIDSENIERWKSMSDFQCVPYNPTGKEFHLLPIQFQKLKEGENIRCHMILKDEDGASFIIPVNATPGYRDHTTVDINFRVCEWITIPRKDIWSITFIA